MKSLLPLLLLTSCCLGQTIPRVWDADALRELELPLATRSATPVYPSASYYYSVPELVIYKSYPSQRPAGMSEEQYMQWLAAREPETAFDAAQLHTQEDWIRAGERVFYAPMSFSTEGARDGRNQWRPWFIRKKGQLEKGVNACASCHVQVRQDGSLVAGAPFDAGVPGRQAGLNRVLPQGEQLRLLNLGLKRDFATPWLDPDPNSRYELWPSIHARNGMVFRQGTSFLSAQPIPDLIGIQDRRYLDHTGLEQHRSMLDFMRYAALNTNNASFQMLGNYGGFIPGGVDFKTLPDPKTLIRYSDAQLYALAQFVYSLTPPANPNSATAVSRQGEAVFRREGCVNCHTPPFYTSNKLTPVTGFRVPEQDRKRYDILPVVVGTDPYLAMSTRRGTGYYKVPSLRGLWYRGPFTHDGSVATLEDWFDAARLRDDYVPTGAKGPAATRAVKGHEFGLKLSAEEKKALIAFLMTI
ncbi:MAG TPA: di-heme oxidoredictase family protein [Candidatus Sulfopaludibacter sp.]|jgi:hypothetical protein|nr:di-heme oxidoredictase family protein [Candidatus Sulfopaludibacter sp.]